MSGTRSREIKLQEHEMSESAGAPRDPHEMPINDSEEKMREQQDMERQDPGQDRPEKKQPESMDESERSMEGARETT